MAEWRTRKRGTRKQRGTRFPLGKRTKRRLPSFTMRIVRQPVVRNRKPLVRATLDLVLSQPQIAKELHVAYSVADSIHRNWPSFKQLYNMYQKEGGRVGVRFVESDLAHKTLFCLQLDIFWATISQFIPKEYHNLGKRVLTKIVDKITNEEIQLVKLLLEENSEKSTKGKPTHQLPRSAAESFPEEFRIRKRKRKWPKEIRYV